MLNLSKIDKKNFKEIQAEEFSFDWKQIKLKERKKLVKKLYYRDGLSTVEIACNLKTTPWAIASFMRRNKFFLRDATVANQLRFNKKPLSFHLKSNLSSKEKRLKLAALMLYWAEGGKGAKHCTVDFCNSDPEMIRIFLKFLREICGVDEKRLRVLLYCYGNQNIDNLLNFWYKLTDISPTQFCKPYVRKDFKIEQSGKMKYGLVHIRYSDKKFLVQIIKWISNYCKKI
jgi:hypothetical protein